MSMIILILIWVIAGIAGFVMSLVCFGHSGSTLEKIFGVVIAWLIGPFYWLYYGFNKAYCG